MTIRDEGHRIIEETVVAIALETWTPPRDDERPTRDYPVHRLLFDARSCELAVEYEILRLGFPTVWYPCEHNDLHLPIFGEGAE